MKPIDKNHQEKRKVFRIIGPIVLGIGLLLIVSSILSFLSAEMGQPPKIGLFFLGMPFMFVGSILTNLGYMGSMARYQAAEIAPVAKDTINYMVDGTQDSIKTIAKSMNQGMNQENDKLCPTCHMTNDHDAKFCKDCGQILHQEKICSQCRATQDHDAKFCDTCGSRLS
jgi:ribosomal protein L40E